MIDEYAVIEKFQNRKAVIGVIGLGYVGLPLALRFASIRVNVIGFDIDKTKVDAIEKGRSYIQQIPSKKIKENQKYFTATTDFSDASKCDGLILCVPTPLNTYREPDLSFVKNTLQMLVPHLQAGQIVSLESTTYPGTTEEEIIPPIEATGFEVGKDIFVVYSPEREDPGNTNFNTQSIPKVIGGVTSSCLNVGTAMYSGAIDTLVPVTNTRTAEMTKLLENIYRSVNIGLVNEMKIVADKMNIDIHEVINAAATKPFGFTKYTPGPGLGGHCIPIDPFYLTWKAKEYGLNTRFIELSGEINRAMPMWVVSKVADALNDIGKPIRDSKLLILGIAYKKNVDDARESPSIEILDLLIKKGAVVEYSDPHLPNFPKTRRHDFDLKSVEISESSIAKYDAVILTTDHDKFEYNLISDFSSLVIDCRNKFPLQSNVISA